MVAMVAVADRAIRGAGTSEASWQLWPGLQLLPPTSAEALMEGKARAVVGAPHPDDEVLAVGGLLALLARGGVPVRVVAVTDGTASHPGSSAWSPQRLVRERPRESRSALRRLGVEIEPIRLGFGDGAVEAIQCQLAERLGRLLAASDAVFTTWRQDGHPDHEATGHACAFAAACAGARLVEVPVWAWHWAQPGDSRLPWQRARRLALDAEACRRKGEALQCFRSQLQADESTGAAPVLGAAIRERAARPYEVVFT